MVESKKHWLDNTTASFFSRTPVEGDYGIEIEMELDNPYPVKVLGWEAASDSSLKAIHSVEYVSKGPIPKKYLSKALQTLAGDLKKGNTHIVPTIRAGVHVHVNMQQYTLREVFRFALLYYCFETVLTKFCGENREGNLFCLRMRDAELNRTIIEEYLDGRSDRIHHDICRYSALNFNSLSKFGSLEFRALQTTPNFEKDILDWCALLEKILDYSKTIQDLTTLGGIISQEGPGDLLRLIVGEDLFNKIYYEGMDHDIMQDFRIIQPLIYMLESKK